MKFLCDVHISFKVVKQLTSLGYQTIHVNNILNKWNTKDSYISSYADKNDLILITKDIDFRNSYFINKTPRRLIKINLGNISNESLIQILTENMDAIKKISFKSNFLIEVGKDYISYFDS